MRFNFTDLTRRALARAREHAFRLGHDYVGTEHLLHGLTEAESIVALLGWMGVEAEDVRARLDEAVRPGRKPGRKLPRSVELPYTSRAKKVLEYAMMEARDRGDAYVSVEHLLAGVVREEQGIGAQVLASLGVTVEKLWLAAGGESGGMVGETRLRISIDEASDRTIYEQIIVRIQEAAATGEVRPGGRLPTVRALADQLDIAPGTVARAYSELERLGVVVTEGARGTFVAQQSTRGMAEAERPETLIGLLRPVVVAAFHLGANAAELRAALEAAMGGIFDAPGQAG